MRIGADLDVVVHVEPQRCSERLRRILLALPGEFFGFGTEIGVQNGIQAALPGRRQLVAGDHGVHIPLDDAVDLREVGQVGAVAETRIDLRRHDAVFLDPVGHVARTTADGQIERTVHTGVLHRLLEIGVAHDPHRRQVVLPAAVAQNLAFEKREGRVGPAGAAAVLVLDRSHGEGLHVGETVPLLLLLFLRPDARREQRQKGRKKDFLHKSHEFR